MREYVMALDQGTTSSRCIIFNKSGTVVSSVQREFPQYYPNPGWVEQNPMEIWSSQLSVAVEAMGKLGVSPSNIATIGITNQRETTIVWDRKTGIPVYNAIVWQCRRTADMIDELKKSGFDKIIRERTGLIPDAYFSGMKIKWILDNVTGVRERAERGELLYGTVDTWLVWNLTKGKEHVTDYTNASRTMLFDIHKLCWDKEILEKLNIPESMLPEVKPSSTIYGVTDESVMGGEIIISCISGDQLSALLVQCFFVPGDLNNTYVTVCFLLINTGKKAITSNNGLLTSIGASLEGDVEYILEGSIFIGGAALQWLRDELRMLRNVAQSEEYAKDVEDTNGMYFVPAFTGLGAPYWDQYARGAIVGLTRGCNKEHFIRAALESIAYQTADVLHAMEKDADITLKELRVDGGASANDFLMQFQSDIINADVLRPDCIETTALGAAYLAGIAVEYWENKDEIKENWALAKTFHPNMEEEKRQKLLKGWKKAVKCAFSWAEEE